MIHIYIVATNYRTKIITLQTFSIHPINGKSEIAFSSRKQRHFQQSLLPKLEKLVQFGLCITKESFFFLKNFFFSPENAVCHILDIWASTVTTVPNIRKRLCNTEIFAISRKDFTFLHFWNMLLHLHLQLSDNQESCV